MPQLYQWCPHGLVYSACNYAGCLHSNQLGGADKQVQQAHMFSGTTALSTPAAFNNQHGYRAACPILVNANACVPDVSSSAATTLGMLCCKGMPHSPSPRRAPCLASRALLDTHTAKLHLRCADGLEREKVRRECVLHGAHVGVARHCRRQHVCSGARAGALHRTAYDAINLPLWWP